MRISIIFANCHGRRKMLTEPASAFLAKHSFSFLSETMVTEAKHEPCFENKINFVVHASKEKRLGRPSGGLEWYANPKFAPKQLFSSDEAIVISVPGLSLIGVYFKPTLGFEELIATVETALASVPPRDNIILGGDINLRPTSNEFAEFRSLNSERAI